ncbi:MAG TPA: tRNA (adenosine(37)-N6)-threonylcarbamoyltransferase complex ATPase subunit type 1 TsaE [bacterium]|nr:tRNA (adenosine(37)-N6)-threonylcarbamoyltransferase complex ATPase subunit type 1 TsaE [bacterium]
MEPFLRGFRKRGRAVITKGEQQTFALGGKFAAGITAGEKTALIGGLGAGKTCFIKGAVKGLGAGDSEACSPTFAIVREYKGPGPVIYHFDFYRLKDFAELENIGYRDYLNDGCSVIFAEWADNIPETSRDFSRAVVISPAGKNSRRVEFYEKKVKNRC